MSGEQAPVTTAWGVHGQQPLVESLRRALADDLLAHAYLFSGPAGAGKGLLATRLVQALNCESEGAPEEERPCRTCRSCRQAEVHETADLEWISIGSLCDVESHRDHVEDGSTRIRICQIRRLRRLANLAPFHAPRRIFVIDTADQLQTEAAHALLKTIEEPPPPVLIVLLATDPDGLLPTIRSRCQELTLRPMPRAELTAALAQQLDIDADEAAGLAADAGGRFGLAVRLHRDPSLRQLHDAAVADLQRLLPAGRNERFDHAVTLARLWRQERDSVLATLDVWAQWWRAQLHAAGRTDDARTETTSTETIRTETDLDVRCSPSDALEGLRATRTARQHLLENANPQLTLEILMLDLPQLAEPQREEVREADLTPA